MIKGRKTGQNVKYPEESPTKEVPIEQVEKGEVKKEAKKKV